MGKKKTYSSDLFDMLDKKRNSDLKGKKSKKKKRSSKRNSKMKSIGKRKTKSNLKDYGEGTLRKIQSTPGLMHHAREHSASSADENTNEEDLSENGSPNGSVESDSSIKKSLSSISDTCGNIKLKDSLELPDVVYNFLCINNSRLMMRTKFCDVINRQDYEKQRSVVNEIKKIQEENSKLQENELELWCEYKREVEGWEQKSAEVEAVTKSVNQTIASLSDTLSSQLQTSEDKCRKHLKMYNKIIDNLEDTTNVRYVIRGDTKDYKNELELLKKENKELANRIKEREKRVSELKKLQAEKKESLEKLKAMQESIEELERQLNCCDEEEEEEIEEKEILELTDFTNWRCCKKIAEAKIGKIEEDRFLYYWEQSKEDEDTSTIIFNPVDTDEQKPNVPPSVKAATSTRLVERLAYDKYTDLNFIKSFLISFRNFMSPIDLLEKLSLRYLITGDWDPDVIRPEDEIKVALNSQDVIRLRVLTVLKLWIESYWYDFNDEALVYLVQELLDQDSLGRKNHVVIDNLRSKIETKLLEPVNIPTTEMEDPVNTNRVFFAFEEANLVEPNGKTFLDFEPDLLAQQLSLLELTLYKKIKPEEFFSQAWNKKNKYITSPNIINLIHLFNKMSEWVCGELVFTSDIWQRIEKMKRFIEIADYCHKYYNFNGALEIVAGLSNSSVHRLKRTWQGLDPEYIETLNELKELMDVNYSKFRKEISSVPPPKIPYLGVFLTDLTFMDDGTPSHVDGLINFNKGRMIAEKIREIAQYQNSVYKFEENVEYKNYLFSILTYDEEEIYQQSLKVEGKKLNKFFGN